jgi:hypothetical protein
VLVHLGTPPAVHVVYVEQNQVCQTLKALVMSVLLVISTANTQSASNTSMQCRIKVVKSARLSVLASHIVAVVNSMLGLHYCVQLFNSSAYNRVLAGRTVQLAMKYLHCMLSGTALKYRTHKHVYIDKSAGTYAPQMCPGQR